VLTLQVIASGILLGGFYACMAIGFSVIWGVCGMINLAHGALMLIGAYISWWLHNRTGVDPFLTVPVAAAALFVFIRFAPGAFAALLVLACGCGQ
jgi:branched-chain amino acid transport system permease protein